MKEIALQLQPSTRDESYDRYFIEDYVENNSKYIKGDVLEFAGFNTCYAKKYGNNPNISIIAKLNHKNIFPNVDYYIDLEDIKTLPKKKFDCIIATQVIIYTENLRNVIENLKSMLKIGGYLIVTVPGPLSLHHKDSHIMFSFSEEAIKTIFSKYFGSYENFKCYGNLEYAQYMLYNIKKNPFQKPIELQYPYTIIMGISGKRKL